jgi:hypothetical protein
MNVGNLDMNKLVQEHRRLVEQVLEERHADLTKRRPDDLGFFDPDAGEPVRAVDAEFDAAMVAVMERAGIHPSLIHAFQKTGRIVSRENQPYLTKADLREWDDAIDEWYAQHPGVER